MSSSCNVASQSALCALEANVVESSSNVVVGCKLTSPSVTAGKIAEFSANVVEVVECKLTSPSVTAGKIAEFSDKFSCNETSLGHSGTSLFF